MEDIAPNTRVPQVGDVVLVRLNKTICDQINKRRADAQRNAERMRLEALGYQAHVGNEVRPELEYPMIITADWGNSPSACVNGQVFLDGNDVYWITSVQHRDSNNHEYRFRFRT